MDAVLKHPWFSHLAKNHGLSGQRLHERVESALLGHPCLALGVLTRGITELSRPFWRIGHVNVGHLKRGHDGKEESGIKVFSANSAPQRFPRDLHPVLLLQQLSQLLVREPVLKDCSQQHRLGVFLPCLLELGRSGHDLLPVWLAGLTRPHIYTAVWLPLLPGARCQRARGRQFCHPLSFESYTQKPALEAGTRHRHGTGGVNGKKASEG